MVFIAIDSTGSAVTPKERADRFSKLICGVLVAWYDHFMTVVSKKTEYDEWQKYSYPL